MSDLIVSTGKTLQIKGTLDAVSGTVTFRSGGIAREATAQETSAELAIPLIGAHVHDAPATFITGAASDDDLGLIAGTLGTTAPTLQTTDLGAGNDTCYARFPNLIVPADYAAGETLKLRTQAGMITAISDNTATIDLEVYAQDGSGAVGSDLCTTTATTINTLISSSITVVDFTITATSLSPGDILDVRVAIAINDAATAVVIGELCKLSWLYTRQ